MTPRPLHKWKTFWFGLFILTALLWAWSTSVGHSYFASLRTGPLTWRGLNSTQGQVHYYSQTSKRATYLDPSRTIAKSSTLGPGREPIWFPPALKLGPTSYPMTDYYQCAIAYWLITLLFLISWSSFLLWRARRIRRLTAHTSSP